MKSVMKKITLVVVLLSFFSLSGCQMDFSKGVKKDFKTGITVTNDGLSYEDYYLAVGDQRLGTSEVSMGDKVYLNFTGVDGFTEENGKVFPGAAMVVTDRDGKEVLHEDDLFSAYSKDGVDKADAKVMSVSVVVGDPMISGESYNWKVRFWDKKHAGEIRAELDLKVK